MTRESKSIYGRLMHNIITLKFKPGERLREIDISEKYDLSRTPIRDVFKKLENDELLEIHSKSGSFVTKIDMNGIADIMFLRSAVEYQVLNSVKGKFSPNEIKFLRDNLAMQQSLCQSKRSTEDEAFANALFDLDNNFHKFIYEKDGKESTLDLLNYNFLNYQRFRFLTFFRDDYDLDKLLRIHTEMVDALEDPDHHDFTEIVHRHNYSGFHGIEKVKEKHPEYFKD
jgi:GntR family transcriptional regulator, rspAB operon transcriptional repressor